MDAYVQTSIDAASNSVNTLYNLLLMAGPILRSVKAPFLFADFLCLQSASNITLIIEAGIPADLQAPMVHVSEMPLTS